MTLTLPLQLERALVQRANKRGITAEQIALETLQKSMDFSFGADRFPCGSLYSRRSLEP